MPLTSRYKTKDGQIHTMPPRHSPAPKRFPLNRKWKSGLAVVLVLVLGSAGGGLYWLFGDNASGQNDTHISGSSAEISPAPASPVATVTARGKRAVATRNAAKKRVSPTAAGSSSAMPRPAGRRAAPAPVAASGPMLGALGADESDAALAAGGFTSVVVSANWQSIEPTEGGYSASAIASVQDEIDSALAAGLSPSLDVGVQYAPSWIFGVGGGTQFIDQYGDVFTGSQPSGNYIANAITDMNVRAQMGDYIDYLGTHLTGLGSVRLGGGANNELGYPSGDAGSQPNAFWFYDASSQAALPASMQGWKPGAGATAQATAFLTVYNDALVNYGVWLEQTAASAFASSVKLEVVLPGWGERPGDLQSAEADLLQNATPEVNQGLDWTDLLPQLPATGRVVAYTTYADATQGQADDPDPAAYIHSILPPGMLEGGESTGNGQSTDAGMNLEFADARQWNWYVANWFFTGQPQTTAQLASAFNGG